MTPRFLYFIATMAFFPADLGAQTVDRNGGAGVKIAPPTMERQSGPRLQHRGLPRATPREAPGPNFAAPDRPRTPTPMPV